jgi:hypothetical protein
MVVCPLHREPVGQFGDQVGDVGTTSGGKLNLGQTFGQY